VTDAKERNLVFPAMIGRRRGILSGLWVSVYLAWKSFAGQTVVEQEER
jgi:hypothetical protein